MLNVKYLVATRSPSVPIHPLAKVSLVHGSALNINQTRHYLPKAFPVFHYRQVATSSQAIAVMLGPDFDPTNTALVEEPLVGLEARGDESIQEPATPLTVSRPNSDQIIIDTTLARPALVVVSEQFFPGWNARVDGAPTALVIVNAALTGVVVPAGSHRVILRFLPKSIMLGALLAIATLSVMGVLLVRDSVRYQKGGA